MRLRPVLAIIIGLTWAAATTVTAQSRPNCPYLPPNQFPDVAETNFRVDHRDGHRILIVEGPVTSGASQRLDSAIRANMPIAEIWFNSPGGVAIEGPLMGQIIRNWGIPTRVPSGWWCVSACNFAFLGGPIRSIDSNGQYAVHMFTATRSDIERGTSARAINERGESGLRDRLITYETHSAVLATEQNDFMIRMGVSRALLSEVMYRQPAAGIRCLTAAELRRFNVVNF